MRGIPHGPRRETQGNPLGLTARQAEILRFVAENQSNKKIAASLRLSPKTVEHHVCAILTKLEDSTRGQAAQHPVTSALVTQHSRSASRT